MPGPTILRCFCVPVPTIVCCACVAGFLCQRVEQDMADELSKAIEEKDDDELGDNTGRKDHSAS